MGPQAKDLKEMANGHDGDDDDSVAETSNTGEGEKGDNNNSKNHGSVSGDKNVLRSKFAAFVILALAAVGLGLMTFFLTRGEELDDFEGQVSNLPGRWGIT